jgi:hypothetical protein
MTLGLQALGTALIHREIRVALMTVGLSCPTLAVRGRAIEDLRTGILTPGGSTEPVSQVRALPAHHGNRTGAPTK